MIQAKLKVIDSNVPWAQEILENEGDLWLQYDMKKGSVVRQGTDLDTLYGKDGSIEQYMQKNDVLVATHVRKIKL